MEFEIKKGIPLPRSKRETKKVRLIFRGLKGR
jgi:hypothetical protein